MRYPLLAMFATLILTLTGCGSPEQPPAKPPEPKVSTPAPATPPAPVTLPAAAPVETPKTATAGKEPLQAGAPAAVPVPAPAMPAAPATPPKAAANRPVAAETITLPASQGPVALPHLLHARLFPCATCHGDGTPGKIDLTKDTAHALCRDCHQAKGAGPTSCTGCHKKS